MNLSLLAPEVQEYLKVHEDTALSTFILKGSPFENITVQELAQQLDGKRRTKAKLPLWHNTPGILFPPKLNLEQTSSEATAIHKANLMSGKSFIDLTGGFGVDCYYFAQQFDSVTHVEMNKELSAFAKANFLTLNTSNINCVQGDSMSYIMGCSNVFDVIYVDPGRRTDHKGKVFMLKDCLPNVPEHLEVLLSKCTHLWIKTAPLLDIAAGLSELKNVSEIHIVAVKNEVKEVLWKLSSKGIDKEIEVYTSNFTGGSLETVSFSYKQLQSSVSSYSEPLTFLYEPNAALMKSGAFDWISDAYGLHKLHQNTHLYTNDSLIPFPGRRFKILDRYKYNKRFSKETGITKANITTRNFGLSVDAIRKKLKIKDGGDIYLFFTTTIGNTSEILVCEKV